VTLRVRRARFYAILGPMFRALGARGDLERRYPGLYLEQAMTQDPGSVR